MSYTATHYQLVSPQPAKGYPYIARKNEHQILPERTWSTSPDPISPSLPILTDRRSLDWDMRLGSPVLGALYGPDGQKIRDPKVIEAIMDEPAFSEGPTVRIKHPGTWFASCILTINSPIPRFALLGVIEEWYAMTLDLERITTSALSTSDCAQLLHTVVVSRWERCETLSIEEGIDIQVDGVCGMCSVAARSVKDVFGKTREEIAQLASTLQKQSDMNGHRLFRRIDALGRRTYFDCFQPEDGGRPGVYEMYTRTSYE